MKLETIVFGDVAANEVYQAPRAASGVLWSKRVSPDDFSLWLCESLLDDGATLEWDGEHGDDGIYLFDGALDIDGRRCPSGGAVIVESGVPTVARAVGRTHIAHFGTFDPTPPHDGVLGPPAPGGHGVHVVGTGGRFVSGKRENVHAVWWADGTCDTCRIQLFKVEGGRHTAGRGPAHSHSQDEIIYLIEGSLRMGAHSFAPRTALCIPADARYALTGGADGHVFLNYRRDVSEQLYARSEPPVLETAMARGGEVIDDLR